MAATRRIARKTAKKAPPAGALSFRPFKSRARAMNAALVDPGLYPNKGSVQVRDGFVGVVSDARVTHVLGVGGRSLSGIAASRYLKANKV